MEINRLALLQQILASELPREEAHRTMIPRGRQYVPPGTHPDTLPGYRSSAVLILLVPGSRAGDDPEIPLIQRAVDDGPHSGQIAFPGGAADPEDRSECETAMREAHEEIGLPVGVVEPLGTLSPLYIDVSGFVITPVVATVRSDEDFSWSTLTPQETEVARILRVPLCSLDATIAERPVIARGRQLAVPSYAHGDDVIWGATAMIVAELLAVCRQIRCCA